MNRILLNLCKVRFYFFKFGEKRKKPSRKKVTAFEKFSMEKGKIEKFNFGSRWKSCVFFHADHSKAEQLHPVQTKQPPK